MLHLHHNHLFVDFTFKSLCFSFMANPTKLVSKLCPQTVGLQCLDACMHPGRQIPKGWFCTSRWTESTSLDVGLQCTQTLMCRIFLTKTGGQTFWTASQLLFFLADFNFKNSAKGTSSMVWFLPLCEIQQQKFVTELCGLVLISTNLTQFVELLKETQTLWLMTEKPSVVDFS